MSRDYDQRVLVVNDESADERVLVVNGDVVNTTTAAEGDFLARQSGLWVPRKIADADIPSTITRDTELSAAVSAEAALRAAADAGLQPLDSDLTAIAALSTTSYGRAFLALADAAAARTALALGTAATQASTAFDAAGAAAAAQSASQPLDSDLTAIAALATTTYGRSLLTQANAAATRSTLGATGYNSANVLTSAQGTTNVGVANKVAINKDPSGTMSLTVTADGTRPWEIELYVPQAYNSTANDSVAVAIYESSTQLATTFFQSPAANASGVLICKAELLGVGSGPAIPSAGSHTYTAFFWALVGGTANLNGAAATPVTFKATQL